MTSTRRRLVLHIGFHRTGSSAVQESLFAARIGLRDHGVVYPQPLSGHPSHLDLATSLGFNPRTDHLDGMDPAAVVERYRRLVDDSPAGSTVVWSSEEFCLGNYLPQAMDNLRVLLGKLDVDLTVSALVRRPIPFLLDVYLTELRNTDSMAEFATWVESFNLVGADFDGRLDVWRDLLGPSEDLRVRCLDEGGDPDRSGPTGALAGVLADIGVDASAVPLVHHPASPIHPRLVEPLLAVRRQVHDPAERRRLLESIIELSPLMEPSDPTATLLGPSALARLRQRLTEVTGSPSGWPVALRPPEPPTP